jgi:16S rRNA (cytidine1402-2'-O)-methyltransferase
MTGGTLWLVSTPIGNLGDLPPRAVEVLAAATLVCCEDTRRTGRLLQHAGIRAERLLVTNEHTEFHVVDEVVAELDAGNDVAVVTDAGTPGVSDPGARLVAAAIGGGHAVSAVPGPVAAVMALTISGLPTDRFVVEGFLPRSGRDRTSRLTEIATEARTLVMYEAPHRIVRTLDDLRATCGDDRRVVVCRELTKLYETVTRGTLASIDLGTPRGEYVVVLEGAVEKPPTIDDNVLVDAVRVEIANGATTRDAAGTVAERFGVSRRAVYQLAIANR